MKALGYTWRVLVNIFYLIVVLFVFNAMQRRHVETTTARPVFEPAKMPANCGLLVTDWETPVRIRLRGGPERTRSAPGDRQGVGGASPLR
jgi:hypothetical protein